MQFTPDELKTFQFDSIIATHDCGAESPYLDNALQVIEWMGGHVCNTTVRVIDIITFAEEVRSSAND